LWWRIGVVGGGRGVSFIVEWWGRVEERGLAVNFALQYQGVTDSIRFELQD
jgi:hypothetical protein